MIRLTITAVLLAGLAGARSYQNVEYARAEGQSLKLDAYVPDGPGPHPAVVIVHGGAWVTGDKGYSVQPLFQPLADAGFAWFSINYRLVQGANVDSLLSLQSVARLAGATDDVRAAVAFVRQRAAEYRVDPARIVLLGESAGAQLSLMAMLKPSVESSVRAGVAFYAPSDLAQLAETSNRIPESIRRAMKGTPMAALLMEGLRNLSPRTFVHKDAPPALLIHGTEDRTVPYEQSVEMCAALRGAGAACELTTVTGGGHGLRWWDSQRGMTGYKARLVEWLREMVK